MIEKQRVLTIDTNSREFKDKALLLKPKISKCFPYYIPNDNKEMREECQELLQGFRELMEKYNDDQHIQSYIMAKVTILRDQCPFQGISDLYSKFLNDLRDQYKNIDVFDEHRLSIYFSNKDFPSLRKTCICLANNDALPESVVVNNLPSNQLFDVLKKIYNFHHGRIPKMEQVLLLFPEYLTRIFDLQKGLLLEEGPLPTDWRYFIAILSVACYNCDYLYNLLVEGFVEAGGDLTWLEKDSKTLPPKLALIIDFNKELAYNPWLIYYEKANHFVFLCENSFLNVQGILMNSQNAWSRQELLQMVIISAFYHSLCCLVFGMGILPELDFPRDHQKDSYLKADDEVWKIMTKNTLVLRRTTEEIINQLRKLVEGNDLKRTEESKEVNEAKEEQQNNDQTKNSRKETLASNSAEENEEGNNGLPGDELNSITTSSKDNSIFENFFGMKPVYFESYPSHNKIIGSEVYEWKTSGYSFLHEIFPETALKIDAKYEIAHKMTRENFGDEENIDTSPFRRSIIYYLEIIHGYSHPDFDYKQMNQLLPKDLKLAIKTIGGIPQNFNFGILNRIPIDLKPYEICHIILLIMESKFQLEMMYGILTLKSHES